MRKMTSHAKLSPSGAHRWMRCPASLRLEQTLPDTSSKYADEGTLAHDIAAKILEQQDVDNVTPEMLAYVNDYAKLVKSYAKGGTLLVEQRVNFSSWIDVPESFGTSDAVILHEDTLTIIDLKYGMGVKVDAVDNEQLMLYALGALYEYEMVSDFKIIVMVVHQPRLNHVSEFVIPVEDLLAFAQKAKDAAATALADDAAFNPGVKQCRFCKAKAVCPALLAEVKEETRDLFAGIKAKDLEEDALAKSMDKIELVEQWCKSVRAEVERRLLLGTPVQGYKLVEGRRGNRKWEKPSQAEELMKTFRLKKDEMYDYTLISPTSAEKLIKDKYPKRWEKMEELIERADGKPSVAPVTDRRAVMVISTPSDKFAALASDDAE